VAELASMSLTFEKMEILNEKPTSEILELADKTARKLTAFIKRLSNSP
jgi:hypothetical protein